MKIYKSPWLLLILILLSLFLTLFPGLHPSQAQEALNNKVFLPIVLKPPYEPEKGVTLAYPNCEDIDALGVGWYVNNSIFPSSGCPTVDKRFVPRIYGVDKVVYLTQALEYAKASGWLLGFVEPNLPWHGNITPQQGAQAWRVVEQAALPAGIKLVAPAPSQHNPGEFDPLGYTWIWYMIDEYQTMYGQKPHFDAMGWNYYDTNPQTVIDFLTARRNEALARGYDIPFWIMEYGGKCWDSGKFPTGNQEIMTQVTPWFKTTPWITRYAWFANRIRGTEPWALNHQSCSLVNPDTNALTPLGSIYAGY